MRADRPKPPWQRRGRLMPGGARDVFIIFSKAASGEAKLALAVKDQLEQLGLFAVEYEDWQWLGGDDEPSPFGAEPAVDRPKIRRMLDDCSIVVLITPHRGEATEGVRTEMLELRECGTPVILVHWSPDGWHPLLDPPQLAGLNVVWQQEIRAAGPDGDVRENQCQHLAEQVGAGCWLASVLRSFQDEHANTAVRLLDAIPDGPTDPLLNFRLQRYEHHDDDHQDWIDPDAVAPLAASVAATADHGELSAFVQDWRSGTDLLAERLGSEARFSLLRPLHNFRAAGEAL